MSASPHPTDYFYAPPSALSGTTIVIEGNELLHLAHVMRKTGGDRIMVVDGAGTAYTATIDSITRSKALCTVTATHAGLHEGPRSVHLGAAVLKHTAAFDFLVEKCTEAGVTSITPLLTARSIPRHARTDRWQKLALAAMKQSGRCILPAVRPLTPLPAFLDGAAVGTARFIPHEKVPDPPLGTVLASVPPGVQVVLCVGPEGGFTEEEIGAAAEKGFRPVSLGPARLRTETAALLATASAAGLLSGR